MALITRVSRLFKADAHAVLDRIEDPVALLRQAVREMEDALQQDQRQLQLLHKELDQVLKTIAGIDDRLARLDTELDVCFDSDRDELARTLIRRKLEHQQMAQVAADRRDLLDTSRRQLEQQVDEKSHLLTSMRQKAELFGIDDSGEQQGPAVPNCRIQDADVEVAFLREKNQRAGEKPS